MIQVSGERDYITVDVNEDHIAQYPREWALFNRACAKERAIPLESIPHMRPCIRDALAELKIISVQDLCAATVPEYLQKFKTWAVQIQGIHNLANGKPKPKFKLIDGALVAA
jgi:hypothetical protein